jgi:hypothetical protein
MLQKPLIDDNLCLLKTRICYETLKIVNFFQKCTGMGKLVAAGVEARTGAEIFDKQEPKPYKN